MKTLLSLALVLLCTAAFADDDTAILRGSEPLVAIGLACGQPVLLFVQDSDGFATLYGMAALGNLPRHIQERITGILDKTPEERHIFISIEGMLRDSGIKVVCPKPKVAT